jgi:AcrR family transcriptional regulator
MEGSVKREAAPARRRYDNSRRQAQTSETRARIIDAARTLFVEHGYALTSVEAAADAADVAPATVYRLFGSKRELLKAIIDVNSGGDDLPIPFHERPEVVALLQEPDPVRYVKRFARIVSETSARLDPLYAVVEAAATVDTDSAGLLALMREQRFIGHGRVARGLADRKALPRRMSVPQAHDTIYAISSPELRGVLLAQRGWTRKTYERWLSDVLIAALLLKDD